MARGWERAGIAEAFALQLVAPAFALGVPTRVLHGLEDRLIDTAVPAHTARSSTGLQAPATFLCATLRRRAARRSCPTGWRV